MVSHELLLAVVILVLCLYFCRKYKTIPGPFPVPILGNISQFKKPTKVQSNYQYYLRYGEIFKVRMGSLIVYFINDAQLAAKIFNDFADKLKGRVHLNILQVLQISNRGAVHIYMGDRWKEAHEFVHKIGNEKQILEKVMLAAEDVNKTSFINLEQLKEGWIPTKYFVTAVQKIFVKFVYSRVVIDQKLETDILKVVDDFEYFRNLQLHELFPCFGYSRDFRQKITDFLTESDVIHDKMVALHKENVPKKDSEDLLDLVLDKEKSDRLETKALVSNIISAAVTNVAHTCSWFIAYMAKYPEVQKKIHEELDKVVGRERLPHLRDNEELKYFNATLNEVMRINPVATELILHTVTEDFECNGYFFARNTQFNINLYNINHNPNYWKDHEKFNPDRFLDWDMNNPNFIPFSTGPRSCPGYKTAKAVMFYCITFLLHRYEIVAPEKFEIPPWVFTGFCCAPDFSVILKLRN